MKKIDPSWITCCNTEQWLEVIRFNPEISDATVSVHKQESVKEFFNKEESNYDSDIIILPCIKLKNNSSNGTLFERFGLTWMTYKNYAVPLYFKARVRIPPHSTGNQALHVVEKELRTWLADKLNEECGQLLYEC